MKKIVADSTCDLIMLENLAMDTKFETIPLKIMISGEEFIDDRNLDLDKMLEALSKTKEKTSSACPSPKEYEDAFEDVEEVFVVTITSKLSGSYNSAMLAKEIYEEKHEGRKVHVFDSLSTSGEMVLIIKKINALINIGKEFNEIVNEVEEYMEKHIHLDFVLYSVDNLVKNGRLNKLVGKAIGVLGIKIVGRAYEGVLQPFSKVRGKDKALQCILDDMEDKGYNGGMVEISHCKNEKGAIYLKEKLQEKYPDANVCIRHTHGLVSYYAELSGILIGFECIK